MSRVSRESVLETALRIVEERGLPELTMRGLAAELGVAVTAIYWHVGNRETLIAELVDRVLARFGDLAATGHTPEQRIIAVGRELRDRIHRHPHMIALVYEHGRTALMMLPAERALAREIAAAGLPPARAALIVRAVLHHVVGSVLLERAVRQSPEQHPTTTEIWHGAADPGIDRPLARALARPADPDRLFDASLRALVRGLLA